MTVNSQRLTVLRQSLETLLTEKRSLNSKVVSDSYNHFKNLISKIKSGQQLDLRPSLKRLEQSLKNEGSYKNVKAKFEQIKADILQVTDQDNMKSSRRDPEHYSPQRQDKRMTDVSKTSHRARTVTLAHAQERAKSRAVNVAPTIKRPVIQTDSPSKHNKTPAIDSVKGSYGRGSPDELVGLNKTISRLFEQLDIDKSKPSQKDTSKSTVKPSKVKTGQVLKSPRGEDVKDVKTIASKLKLFEDEFQKRQTTQDESFRNLHTEMERLKAALTKKEQELDRLRATHSIVQKAKGKTFEKMVEIHEHEKRDMVVKLQNLELNMKKNLEGQLKENDEQHVRQVFDNISTEILRLCTLVNKRNKIHRTRSEAYDLTKDKFAYDDLLPKVMSLGEEIQTLQKTKSELTKDNQDLQVWKTSFSELTVEIDSLWKDVYSNQNYPDVRHLSKGIDSNSPRSKAAPYKSKLATAKALLINNTKKLEETERRLTQGSGSSNSNEIVKKLTEELSKLYTDFNGRLSNSRLSLRSVSTNKSDENQDTMEVITSVKNIRRLLQDFESRIADSEKFIKEHDKDLEILRHKIVKLGAGVLEDDNIHEKDSEIDSKDGKQRVISDRLGAMVTKLEIFDERLKYLQDQNKIFKRQLEGKDASSHRLAVMETDLQELCNILKVSDTDRLSDSGDKLKSKMRLCKNVSKKLTDEKENIERKLAKAIIDVTEITKHIATLHHHSHKIKNKQDDALRKDSNTMLTAVEEAQQKLNEITRNIDDISAERDEFKRKYKGSVEDLSKLARKIHELLLELEGKNSEEMRPKSAEFNYLADIEALGQQLWRAVGDKKAYKDSSDEKSKTIADQKDQISKFQVQVSVRDHDIKEKNSEIQRLKAVSGEFAKEIKQLQDNVEKISGDKRQIEKESQNLKSNLEKTTKELQDLQEEKSTLLRRLSKAMGNALMDGNPNIANLNDQNRPEKIAEKFSQLYDDEWTNAYEILTGMFSMDEKMAINCLLNVARESYLFCQDMAASQLTDLTRVLMMLHADGLNDKHTSDNVGSLQPDEVRQIKEVRNIMAKYSAANVIQLYQNTGQKGYITEEQLGKCEQFVHKCVELCWLMAGSSPPIYMQCELKSGELIDTDMFKFYSNSGGYCAYVVWPALLLQKQGPVLCKGVVQPL